jgi:hypothetical protein
VWTAEMANRFGRDIGSNVSAGRCPFEFAVVVQGNHVRGLCGELVEFAQDALLEGVAGGGGIECGPHQVAQRENLLHRQGSQPAMTGFFRPFQGQRRIVKEVDVGSAWTCPDHHGVGQVKVQRFTNPRH